MGKIIGEQLRRAKTGANGSFLTALRPYTGAWPAKPTATAITSGRRVDMSNTDGVKSLLALFPNPGAGSTNDTLGNQVFGVFSAVLYTGSSSQPARKAASMIQGTYLRSGNTDLVTASQPTSVGITYLPNAIWGTIDIPDGQSSVTLWIYTNGQNALSTTVRYRGVGNPLSPLTSLSGTVSGGGIQFTVYEDGQFQIDLPLTPPPLYWNLTECAGP